MNTELSQLMALAEITKQQVKKSIADSKRVRENAELIIAELRKRTEEAKAFLALH
jgi:tellurite resistance protein